MIPHEIDHRRAIIDRRAVAECLADRGADAGTVLHAALDAGRAEIARRLAQHPGNGRAAAARDVLPPRPDHPSRIRTCDRGVADPSGLALVALGGSGRGEMAPYSDVDLMVLTAKAPTAKDEAAAQALFHLLWELKLKVGHSVRSVGELLPQSKKDMTVRTAMLEARALWGDYALFDLTTRRFRKEVVAGTAAQFVSAKLAERDQRHIRMGDSRYVVEPNVKDGKGGLRDLHTLYWIGKYVHAVERPSDLVGAGLLTAAEFRRFDRAERFFWSVRCHLHLLAGRAEERLSFAYQPRIAKSCAMPIGPGSRRSSGSCNSTSSTPRRSVI